MIDDRDMPEPGSPLDRAITSLRRPVSLGDGPTDRAMAVLSRPQRRLWPLWVGAGLAAGLALVISLPSVLRHDLSPGERPVHFVLQDSASRVSLIGDFNDWNRTATPLQHQSGVWTATVALKPGRYRYAFLVDGERVEADPRAPAAIDEFGGSTSAITIGR